jgi:hypothetical protein
VKRSRTVPGAPTGVTRELGQSIARTWGWFWGCLSPTGLPPKGGAGGLEKEVTPNEAGASRFPRVVLLCAEWTIQYVLGHDRCRTTWLTVGLTQGCNVNARLILPIRGSRAEQARGRGCIEPTLGAAPPGVGGDAASSLHRRTHAGIGWT